MLFPSFVPHSDFSTLTFLPVVLRIKLKDLNLPGKNQLFFENCKKVITGMSFKLISIGQSLLTSQTTFKEGQLVTALHF